MDQEHGPGERNSQEQLTLILRKKYLSSGLEKLEKGLFFDALEFFKALIKIDLDNPDAWFWKGFTHAKMGNTEEANRALKIATDIYPEKGYNKLLSSREEAIQADLHTDAIKAFDAVLELDRSNLNSWARKGMALLYLERSGEALEIFNEILVIDPSNSQAQSGKGQIICKMENYEPQEKDLGCINTLLNKDPDNPTALYKKGLILLKISKPHKAMACFQLAIDKDPRNPLVWVGLGEAFYTLNRYQEAYDAYIETLKIDPHNNAASLGKTLTLVQLGQQPNNLEFLKAFNEILRDQPENYDILLKKSKVLVKLNQFDEALHELNKILKKRPGEIEAVKLKGNLLLKRGLVDDAIQVFEEFLAIDKNNADILYLKGECSFRLKRFDDALLSFKQVLKIFPEHPGALFYSGVCLSELNHQEDARDMLTILMDLPQKNFSILLFQGLAYCRIGQREEACRIYHEILDSDLKKTYSENEVLLQLKNSIQFIRDNNQLNRLKKNNKTNSIDFPLSGNFVLEAISSFGEMKFERFNLALQMLVAAKVTENQRYVFKNIRTSFIRALQALGHCEFDFQRRIVSACNPSIVALPSSRKKRAVLIGARTGEQIKRILGFIDEKNVEGSFSVIENTIPISYNDPCAPLIHLPSTVIISGKSNEVFSRIADEFSLSTDLKKPACFSLSNFSISLADYRKNMNPSLENDINWEKMFFDPVRIRFSRYGEIYKDKPTLVSCINPRDQQYTHFYWNDGLGSIVDRDWGRYLIFQDTRKNVLVFDPEKQQLGVPAPCPLPLLLTRAATLCSGKTPSQISYYYPHDGDQKDVIPLNIYDNVPAEIAERIAEKVGQELIPDKFAF